MIFPFVDYVDRCVPAIILQKDVVCLHVDILLNSYFLT